ncbi:MAG: hypothetical protein WCB68_15900 [Pyrinomonadaceae bacterium]
MLYRRTLPKERKLKAEGRLRRISNLFKRRLIASDLNPIHHHPANLPNRNFP